MSEIKDCIQKIAENEDILKTLEESAKELKKENESLIAKRDELLKNAGLSPDNPQIEGEDFVASIDVKTSEKLDYDNISENLLIDAIKKLYHKDPKKVRLLATSEKNLIKEEPTLPTKLEDKETIKASIKEKDETF